MIAFDCFSVLEVKRRTSSIRLKGWRSLELWLAGLMTQVASDNMTRLNLHPNSTATVIVNHSA